MIEYICVRRCFWLSLIEEGQIITADNESEIPPSVRPFFDYKDKVAAEKIVVVETEEAELEDIKAELEKRNIVFDRRWGRAKLEGALQMANRDK